MDESMSIWTSKFSCPGWIFVPRKPHLMGNKYHTICCGQTQILYQLELVEGKDRSNKYGANHTSSDTTNLLNNHNIAVGQAMHISGSRVGGTQFSIGLTDNGPQQEVVYLWKTRGYMENVKLPEQWLEAIVGHCLPHLPTNHIECFTEHKRCGQVFRAPQLPKWQLLVWLCQC